MIETARTPGMASDSALLFTLQQNHIAIAIKANLPDLLDMPGFFTLVPKFLTRTRPIHRFAFLPSKLQSLAIHPRNHQHPSGNGILSNGSHQTVGGPIDLV